MNGISKKLSMSLYVLLSLIFLFGCGKDAAAATEEIPVVTEVVVTHPPATNPPETNTPTQPTSGSGHTDEPVYPGIDKTFQWKDSVGNSNDLRITVPFLTGEDALANSFNAQIKAFADPILTEVSDCQKNGYSALWNRISYVYHRNRDILSIVIILETPVDLIYYDVYNFDLEERAAITIAEMCDDVLDLNYPQFLIATTRWVRQEFDLRFADHKESDPEF